MKLNIAYVFFFATSVLASATASESASEKTNLRGLSTGTAPEAWEAPLSKNGKYCTLNEQCLSGSCQDKCPRRPNGSSCQPKSSVGGPCANDSWCDPQYVCDTNTLRSTYGCYYQYGTCKLS